MDLSLDALLEFFLLSYPNAKGVSFHSLELPITKFSGTGKKILDKYKDIPMMSVDESFNTNFSFIVTNFGSIVIFFLEEVHFVSVFTESAEPNKELAQRMFEEFKEKFSAAIKNEQ
ncbi:MAG: hypothetical protein AAGI25_20825 [Bacteroidota bacterium]